MTQRGFSTDAFIAIRPMKATDIKGLIKLRRNIENSTNYMPTGPGDRQESVLYNLLKMYFHKDRVINYLAFYDGELVGYVSLVFGRYRKFRGNAYIANVSVAETMRGKGIGKLLMQKAEEIAGSRNARRLELEVFATNINAKGLYEKLGYEVEGVKRKAVKSDQGYEDLVFMAKFI